MTNNTIVDVNNELWVIAHKEIEKSRVSKLKDELTMCNFRTKVIMNEDLTWNIYYKPSQSYRS